MNKEASQFFAKEKRWKAEFDFLRAIISKNKSLTEEYKWMHPCYTFRGKNVLLIHGFKDYCALLFHKGVLLKDKKKVLIQQTENVQSARQIRFTSAAQIRKLEAVITAYTREAIEIEESGKKVALKKASDYPVAEEFQKLLEKDKALHKAFYSLTPGRQKGYLFYFNQAKQSKTREARMAKYIPRMLEGKGLDD